MVEYEYAKALFDLAAEEKKVEIYDENLAIVFNSIVQNPDFQKLLCSPVIDVKEKRQMIHSVYHKMDKDFLSFLCILIEHNRFNLISTIKDEYHQLLSNYQNILDVEVISAEKLSKSKLALISEQLTNKYPQKNIKIQNTVDSSMLYGIQIMCNGESLDLSLKNRLNLMKDSL